MKNWRFVLGVLGSIAAVIFVSVYGATSAGTDPYNPDLMASWVQAVGSIAAIVGAVWIATHESRRRRRELIEIARVNASGLAVRLTRLRMYLAVATEAFREATIVDPSPQMIAKMKECCAHVHDDAVAREEIEAVVPLPGNIAEKLAAALACIHLVKHDFLVRADHVCSYSGQEKKASLHFWYEQLAEALKHLSEAHDDCGRAARVKIYLVTGS